MGEDLELDRIKRAKLRGYLNKASKSEPPKKSEGQVEDIDQVVYRYLDSRAVDVMKAAESQFPEETRAIKLGLHKMIKDGRLQYVVDGGTLLLLFRTLGLRVYVETEVKFVEHGKAKSLAEKLSENFDTEK